MSYLIDDIHKTLKCLRSPRSKILIMNTLYSIIKRRIKKCLHNYLNFIMGIYLYGSYVRGTLLSYKWEMDTAIVFYDSTNVKLFANDILNRLVECFNKNNVQVTCAYINNFCYPYLILSLPLFGRKIHFEISIMSLNLWRLTHYHDLYIINVFKRYPYLRDDILLFKDFMKKLKIYGDLQDDFPGLAIEYIVIYYNGLSNALRSIANWKPPVIINLCKNIDVEAIVEKYEVTPITLIDPLGKTNITQFVSLNKLNKLILASKRLLSLMDTLKC